MTNAEIEEFGAVILSVFEVTGKRIKFLEEERRILTELVLIIRKDALKSERRLNALEGTIEEMLYDAKELDM